MTEMIAKFRYDRIAEENLFLMEENKRQANIINVLEKAFDEVSDGMQVSLDLNKAQTERYYSNRTPLTEEQICKLFNFHPADFHFKRLVQDVRTVEEAHGIK